MCSHAHPCSFAKCPSRRFLPIICQLFNDLTLPHGPSIFLSSLHYSYLAFTCAGSWVPW